MSHQTKELFCELQADTRRLAELFDSLKASRVNIRKIELMEKLTSPGTFYLYVMMDYTTDIPQQLAAIEALQHTFENT